MSQLPVTVFERFKPPPPDAGQLFDVRLGVSAVVLKLSVLTGHISAIGKYCQNERCTSH